ncbi:MAG: hypothetical protein MUC42_05450, partial [Bryobacter sp.]|nr:hypothetical protein [Bryobacter sp.]
MRFYAIQTRRLLGPLNGPADSCIITGLCSLSVSCPVCVKWDTISTDIYDQIDVVKPTPCDQRELERIKAEITRLFYERVNAIQQDINTQIREKCSAKNISAKYGIYLGEKLHHVTLYYYDRAGRLVRTVSPKGVD